MRNDLLDPSRGYYLNIGVSPYDDLLGSGLSFFKEEAAYSRYFRLSTSPSLLLAARGNIGVIEGASLTEIPADLRFYAGGGGSIRGYAYQTAGPLINGTPTGGKSLFVVSTELRTKISESVGLVFFIDGGSVFQSSLPDLGEPIFWGAGVGFRYFTSVGPLRLDVALPVNPREGVDDAFQIYVSLGQAF